MNKYDMYCKKYEKLGLLKPIYKNDHITICNVSDLCYYLISNEVGVAINVKSDFLMQIIENPDKTFEAYTKLPLETQKKVSFFVDKGNAEKLLNDLKKLAINEPHRVDIDSKLEKKIMQEYGMAGRSK